MLFLHPISSPLINIFIEASVYCNFAFHIPRRGTRKENFLTVVCPSYFLLQIMTGVCGGYSHARIPTNEEREFLTSRPIRQALEERNQSPFPSFHVVAVKTQVVAGTNYQVKYHVGSKYVHATIFKPLPCQQDQSPVVLGFVDHCTGTDELQL